MTQWGLGDTIVAIVLALNVLLPPLLVIYGNIDDKRMDRLIQAAQDMELGEGVTLLQGIWAHYKQEGLWLVQGRIVVVLLRAPGSPVLCVDTKTWKLWVSTYQLRPKPLEGAQVDILVDAMIRAAKGRGSVN